MKYSTGDLLDVVYRHYPRGINLIEQADIERYKKTEEHARLVAARLCAATCAAWR
ncbi:hypothetical protein WME98_17015 [Sorangium sp. So ce296]|uniref:hypothetical protein n=1 Tax=Sorangium sp. So ce296 TaxID=3133296 RepID=UPI003F6343E5